MRKGDSLQKHMLFQAMSLSPLPRLCPLRALRMLRVLWSLGMLRAGLGGSSAAGNACWAALCLATSRRTRLYEDLIFLIFLNTLQKCDAGAAAARAWCGTRQLGAETAMWLAISWVVLSSIMNHEA